MTGLQRSREGPHRIAAARCQRCWASSCMAGRAANQAISSCASEGLSSILGKTSAWYVRLPIQQTLPMTGVMTCVPLSMLHDNMMDCCFCRARITLSSRWSRGLSSSTQAGCAREHRNALSVCNRGLLKQVCDAMYTVWGYHCHCTI